MAGVHPRIPARVQWALEVLPLRATDRVLEIGCGNGVALSLICAELTSGRITGVDRSATAIASAEKRNAAYVRAGRLSLVHAALSDAPIEGPFDLALAINVNAFWIDPERELAAVRQVLAPSGRLLLFYEPPTAQLKRIVDACTRFLNDGGFRVVDIAYADPASHSGVCIQAALSP